MGSLPQSEDVVTVIGECGMPIQFGPCDGLSSCTECISSLCPVLPDMGSNILQSPAQDKYLDGWIGWMDGRWVSWTSGWHLCSL